MKMTKIEKKFVNSKKQGEKNLKVIKELFKKYDFSKVKNVLEIGCGAGVVAAYLSSEKKMKVIASDLDSEQIQLAKENQKESSNLKFIEADATKLPFEDKKFDMVLSLNVFHHIPNWEKAISEIDRVLKKKGFFIFYDLAYANITKKIFKPFAKNYGLYTINDIISSLQEKNSNVKHLDKKKIIMKTYTLVIQKN